MRHARQRIAEIGIGPAGSLYVVPSEGDFPFIYRAAMQVGWDDGHRRLFSPIPSEMSYADWFRRILSAVDEEYAVRLTIDAGTIWTDVPSNLRAEIESLHRHPEATP